MRTICLNCGGEGWLFEYKICEEFACEECFGTGMVSDDDDDDDDDDE